VCLTRCIDVYEGLNVFHSHVAPLVVSYLDITTDEMTTCLSLKLEFLVSTLPSSVKSDVGRVESNLGHLVRRSVGRLGVHFDEISILDCSSHGICLTERLETQLKLLLLSIFASTASPVAGKSKALPPLA